MATREDALAELYRRGKLDDRQKSIVEELAKRGAIQLAQPVEDQPGILDYLMSVGEPAAALVSGAVAEPVAGIAGLAKTITSGPEAGAETIGQVREAIQYEPRTAAGQQSMQAIGETLSPVVKPIGEAVQAVGDIAYEAGGPIAGAGAITMLSAIPEILGLRGTKAAKKTALQKIVKQSSGDVTSIFDDVGALRPEIKQSLQAAGIPESEFLDILPKEAPGQAARMQKFQEAGIQPTTGELKKDFAQQATEQRLLESSLDTASEPFRQFKLRQSEGIKKNLEESFGAPVSREETGQLIQDALTGRKKLLRTQKNELYQTAAENAKDVGTIPIFPDTLTSAIPDNLTMQRLKILDESGSKRLDDWLTRFGVKESTEAMVDAGFEPELLTLENFDLFRQGLNEIGKSSDAIKVATGPITKALDIEADELAAHLQQRGVPDSVLQPLKEARKTVRQIKTEFSPQALTGRIIESKPDGFTPITEASKVYDKLSARSTAVEETRRVVNSLKKAEKGEEALASLQASVLMDLIDAGFGTESRQISGIRTFNPVAFKKRLKNIGQDKVDAIFSNNRDAFRKIRNIDQIASELIPPAGAVPKGSASVILDLANKLGLAGISAKVPGGPLIIGAMQKISEPVKVGADVRKAINAQPDVIKLQSMVDMHYPGIAAAIGVSKALQQSEKEPTDDE